MWIGLLIAIGLALDERVSRMTVGLHHRFQLILANAKRLVVRQMGAMLFGTGIARLLKLSVVVVILGGVTVMTVVDGHRVFGGVMVLAGLGAVPCVLAAARPQDANGPTRRERVNHTGVGRGSESSGVPGLITPSACPRLDPRRKFPFAPTAGVDQMSRRSPVTAEENDKTRLQPLATWLEVCRSPQPALQPVAVASAPRHQITNRSRP